MQIKKTRNRTLSIRSSKSARSTTTTASSTASHDHHHHQHGQHSRGSHRFSLLNSLRNRSSRQPTPAKRLHRLIKTFSGLVGAHEQAARARLAMAEQLAEWGEERQHHHDQHDQQLQQHHMGRDGDDEAVADVSDKIGVLLAELGEQEGRYAAALEGRCRAALKSVRDTERGVGPAREAKARLAGEIARLKAREPQSARLVTLEQQLVRAEAEGLVGEAQVANVVCVSPFFLSFCSPVLGYGDMVLWLKRGVEEANVEKPRRNRRGKSSRRRTRPSSWPPSSAPKSRSSCRGTACACCSSSTTRRLSRAMCGRRMRMPRRRGRS